MSTVAAPQAATSTWNIDPVHSVAEFKVKHMMISNVKGQFTGLQGVLTHDETDVTKSRVETSIDATSITTRDAQRDAHLKSADFLDVEKFPTLSFKSTQIKRSRRRGIGSRGRPHHSRRHQKRGIHRRRTDPAGQGSLGKYALGCFRRPRRSIARTSA